MDVEGDFEARAALHRALGDAHRLRIVAALALGDLSPKELAEGSDLPMNLLAFHLRVLEEVGLVERTRSSGDARRRYVRLHPEQLAHLVPEVAVERSERVLFVCTHNAARSQIAAALWRGRTGFVGESAGSAPARAVHPLAVAIAGSRGVDLSTAAPRGLDAVEEAPDLVVTVCDRAREGVVPFPDRPRLHWSVADPIVEGTPAAFARAYDYIGERVEELAERMSA